MMSYLRSPPLGRRVTTVNLKRPRIAVFKQEKNYPHRFFTFEKGKWEVFPRFGNVKHNAQLLRLCYQGVDSFWAFAEIFPGLHFVIVAPKSMVMELSEEVGKSFTRYTIGQKKKFPLPQR